MKTVILKKMNDEDRNGRMYLYFSHLLYKKFVKLQVAKQGPNVLRK